MAERIPREETLRRVHGVGALFSTAYGNVGSSIYYALGVVAAFALGLTPLAFLIAGLIFVCTAATYAEGTVLHPEAGGSSSFARHAFNELVSFVAAWGQMLNYVITVAISAFFVPHYLAVVWEPLGEAPGDVIAGVAIVAILCLVNIVGSKESARLNLVLAIADLLTQVALVGLGIALVLDPDILVSNVELGVAPTWSDFALGIALGMIAYTGIETLSNMAEEARDVARTVPVAVGYVLVAVLTLYILIPLVALSAMPVTLEGGEHTTALATTYKDNPMLGIVDNLGLSTALTDALRVYVGLLAGVILIIATNAGLIGLSRLTFSMGQYRQLPQVLRTLHPRFGTPYVAIIIFGAIGAVALIPGEAELLATMYSFGAMLSFTVAHIAIVRLRFKDRRRRRWKPPLEAGFGSVKLPVTAIIGGLGTLTAWVVVMALNLRTLAIGAAWMAIGIALYVAYRRNQQLSLTSTAKILAPEPLGVQEVELKSVLVAFPPDQPFSEGVVTTATALATKRRRAIHVLSLMEVPQNLPLDAKMLDAEGEAQAKIERARLICGQRLTGSVVRVRPGQAGGEIVRMSDKLGGAAVVMELRYRDGKPLYTKTLQTVLAKRPGRVIITARPETSRAYDSGGARA